MGLQYVKLTLSKYWLGTGRKQYILLLSIMSFSIDFKISACGCNASRPEPISSGIISSTSDLPMLVHHTEYKFSFMLQ